MLSKLIKKVSKKQVFFYIILILLFIASMIFINHNYAFYERPIVKVIETNLEDSIEVTDAYDNEDKLYTQRIIAEFKNGGKKGQLITLTNEYSISGAYDQEYHIGNDLFIAIDKNKDELAEVTGSISDVKRDKFVLLVAWAFIFTLIIIGRKQGFFAIISLIINAAILSYALDIYVKYSNISLLLICSICILLFTLSSLLLVNGFNEKTYAAIVASVLGTFISLAIAYLVLWVTSENGLRYEEMSFLTRPYKVVFMAGLFVGSLGAVMDVAITMSSSIFELYEKNNNISIQTLKKSAMDIGRDIMGTMTNILFFAYISGSIPVLILYFMNNSHFWFTMSINLSLELARALAGGIGIVLTIPIGLYTSIFFVKRKKAKQ